jgi:hypothetical protein
MSGVSLKYILIGLVTQPRTNLTSVCLSAVTHTNKSYNYHARILSQLDPTTESIPFLVIIIQMSSPPASRSPKSHQDLDAHFLNFVRRVTKELSFNSEELYSSAISSDTPSDWIIRMRDFYASEQEITKHDILFEHLRSQIW